MNQSLNASKGAAIKHWLQDRIKYSGAPLRNHDLSDYFRRSKACTEHKIIDADEADDLAAQLNRFAFA